MRLAVLSGLACLMLIACVAHEKNGDRAAALGDWRTAVFEYREAVSKDPDDPQLRAKFEAARREAVAAALRKAEACVAAANFECAVGECDFVMSLDAGNVQAARLRADAAKVVAQRLLASARSHAGRKQVREGFEALERAARTSSAPELAAEAGEVRGLLVAAALERAREMRAAKQYDESIALLELASNADGAHTPLLAEVRAEYETYKGQQYDAACEAGDRALASRLWAVAAEQYGAALRWRRAGRAEPLARYAAALDRADAALQRRDFAGATGAYREAAATGADSPGYAAAQLDAVEVRPYAVRVRTLLVKPVTPEGRPWVGPPSPFLGLAVKAIAGYALPVAGAVLASKVVDAAEAVPPENRPMLSVEVTLPDGRKLVTPKKKALYAIYDSSLVVATNQFDERKLQFRVVGEGDRRDDVGAFDVALKDLVRARVFTGTGESVQGLQVVLGAADGMVDGQATEMAVQPGEGDNASSASVALPGRLGYRLVSVSAELAPGDYQNELGMDGAPEPQVEIEQGGRVVFAGPKLQDTNRATWTPTATFLFVEPGETIGVRVWDVDAAEHDLVLNAAFFGRALESGVVRLQTQRGSSVELRFELRRVGP